MYILKSSSHKKGTRSEYGVFMISPRKDNNLALEQEILTEFKC